MNLKVIVKAWYHYLNATPEIQETMKRRLEICNTCPDKVQYSPAGQVIMNLTNDINNTFKCGLCDCPLGAMSAHPIPQCKANKWT